MMISKIKEEVAGSNLRSVHAMVFEEQNYQRRQISVAKILATLAILLVLCAWSEAVKPKENTKEPRRAPLVFLDDLKELPTQALKEKCRELGLRERGMKLEIVQRIYDHLNPAVRMFLDARRRAQNQEE